MTYKFRSHVASVCRAERDAERIAFLGPLYSYSHQAALSYFGEGAELIPEVTIAAVFDAVAREQVTSGIVPVENSTDGRVVDTLSMFVQTSVKICGVWSPTGWRPYQNLLQ